MNAALTATERDFLDRVARGAKLRLAFRDEDRARQACRRRGFVLHLKSPNRWEITEAGLAALQEAWDERDGAQDASAKAGSGTNQKGFPA